MQLSWIRILATAVLFFPGTTVFIVDARPANAQHTAFACDGVVGPCCGVDCETVCGNTCGNAKTIYDGAHSSLRRWDEDYLWTLGSGPCSLRLKVGAWAEAGIFTNSHGATRTGDVYGGNGPMHIDGQKKNDLTLQQLYFYLDKEIDTTCGWDWGFRADMYYGADAPLTQSYGDRSFDDDWGNNRHGYGISAYQLYATVGYENIKVRGGKFGTPLGWETVASRDNFFYSHSLCYYLEPGTHVGALADYTVNDRLTFTAGRIAGNENGFANRFDDYGLLLGFRYAATKNIQIAYYLVDVKTHNGIQSDGIVKLGAGVDHADNYVQSFCLQWTPADRFTWVFQHNYRTDKTEGTAGRTKTKTFGVNNHLIYKLDDCWSVGARLGWLRDEGGAAFAENDADYYETTLGVNWNPNRHWSFRPEIRYDWSRGARPFADGTKSEQLSGGVGILYIF